MGWKVLIKLVMLGRNMLIIQLTFSATKLIRINFAKSDVGVLIAQDLQWRTIL